MVNQKEYTEKVEKLINEIIIEWENIKPKGEKKDVPLEKKRMMIILQKYNRTTPIILIKNVESIINVSSRWGIKYNKN